MVSRAEKALQLKNEGNELFEKKQFAKSYEKYTAAIDEDEDNAVLYSNRAACSLATRKYLDASGDAKRATELDPKFSRAWARLATAAFELGSFKQSGACWKRAIETLDMSKPTSAKLAETYEANLKRAEERLENIKGLGHRLDSEYERNMKLPWDRAAYLVPIMKENEVYQSSAYVVHSAHEAFQSGWDDIETLAVAYSPDGKFRALPTRSTNAVSKVVEGLLRDRRVFCVSPDDDTWTEKMNAQIRVEMTNLGVSEWVEIGSEALLEEAKRRLRTDGWEVLRPAICTAVRAWILRAFIVGMYTHDWPSSLRWFETAIDVIERGRKIWQKVPKKDRGPIFDNGFFLAVRGLYVEAMFQAYVKTPNPTLYTIPRLLELSENLYRDSKKWKPNPDEYKDDIGAMYGYFVYPRAEALGIQAFCYKEMAKNETQNVWNCVNHAKTGAELYRQAAEEYPLDEERRAFYLAMCLDTYWKAGYATVGELFPICDELRKCVPKMRGIWQHSSMQMQGNRELFELILNYDTDMKALVKKKQLKEDERSKPWFIQLFPLPKSKVTPDRNLPNGMNIGKPRITN